MRSIIISVLLIFMADWVSAQNAHFSQFYSNPLYLAPSFAGGAENTRFVLNYREQWAKLPGHFTSYSFSTDHYFKKFNSGMGLLFFSDQAGGGKMVTTNIAYQYSYKIRLTYDFYLQPGISAYYYSRSINSSSLNFADQFFSGEFVGTTSETLPADLVQHADFAFSILGYTENFWGGFNLNHLMSFSPVLSVDPKYPDLYLSVYGGAKITTKWSVQNRNNETFHVAFNFRSQSKVHQLDIGGYFFKNPLYFGLWYRGLPIGNVYRTSDAIIFLLGIKYNQFIINYSYDMSLGSLISSTGGSHEISIVYSLNSRNNVSSRGKYRKIPCPTYL